MEDNLELAKLAKYIHTHSTIQAHGFKIDDIDDRFFIEESIDIILARDLRAPADATAALSSAAMTFTLASIPADVTNLKLILLASEPQGNGITKAYSKAAAFDDPLTPVATAIDIKAKYDAKNGAPSAGYPKVFFKYFYVNTATGEKSGEKMASAVLSE